MSTDLNSGATGADASAAATATASQGGETQAQDYIQRIRTDPEFAEKEVRNLKSRHDRFESELQKLTSSLGPLKDVLGTTPGHKVVEKYQAWQMLENHPEMGQIVTDFALTGEVPTRTGQVMGQSNGSNSLDDDFMTDTERTLKAELAELKAQLQQVTGRLGRTESSFGQSALQQSFQTVMQGLDGLPDAARERIQSEVAAEVDQLAERARKGDALALRSFESLSGPQGLANVERLVRSRITDDENRERFRQMDLRKQQELAGMSTGGPGLTAGGDEALDASQHKGSPGDAIRHARLHAGRNPYS